MIDRPEGAAPLAVETVVRARRLVKALRDPDPAFKAVANTVRQAAADLIETLLARAEGRQD